MALDNAQFISELSITDPPGTDAVAEGDDHIRTVKRATQQSFPNVDAAVPQTAAQMGQMAIKNEVNVFTQINTFAPDQLFTEAIHVRKQANNNVADIRYQDGAGINRWIVRFDSDQATLDDDFKIQRRDAAGAFLDDPITISAAQGRCTFPGIAFFGAELRAFGGNSTFPAYTFTDDANTGMFSNQVGFLSFSASGNANFIITPTSSSHITRLDMSEKIRFNNFNSNHGITWRANGSLTWELIAVHSLAPLTRLTFDRYVGGVFQDQPLQLHNDTGHVNMPVLPTNFTGLVKGSLYAKQSQLFAGTELVVGVAP